MLSVPLLLKMCTTSTVLSVVLWSLHSSHLYEAQEVSLRIKPQTNTWVQIIKSRPWITDPRGRMNKSRPQITLFFSATPPKARKNNVLHFCLVNDSNEQNWKINISVHNNKAAPHFYFSLSLSVFLLWLEGLFCKKNFLCFECTPDMCFPWHRGVPRRCKLNPS